MIAADVDITTISPCLIYWSCKLILGIYDKLPNNTKLEIHSHSYIYSLIRIPLGYPIEMH